MVTYVIASKAKSSFLAECESLGEYLEKNCNDVKVKTVIKHKKEWADFLDSTCRTYGFKKRSCPIVYTIEGTLIGDAQQFIDHIKDKYSKVISITKESQKRRTLQNIKMINEYMRKKIDGLTLGEKITQHLNEVKANGLIQLIDDAFFKEEIDKGCQFFVRRTNFMINDRTLNIIDEIEERFKMQRAFEEAEAKRDMTYDEFLGKYIDHIEGKVSADDRQGARPLTAEGDEAKPGNVSKEQLLVEESKGEEGEKKSEKLNDSTLNKSKNEELMNKSKDSLLSKEDYKFEIPDSCYLILMKGNKIEKLHKKYALLSHPHPLLEGEMILFQPNKQDQYDQQLIIYRDYSLRKRLPTKPKPKKLSSYQQKKLEKEDEEVSKLRSLEIDLKTPLSHIDWKNLAEVVDEVKGLGWVQILPVGEKSSQQYQCQLIHVLPNSKIPFASLPLDVLISNKVAFAKQQHDAAMEDAKLLAQVNASAPKKKDGKKDDKKETQAQSNAGMITLDEYNFPHAVYVYEGSLKADLLNLGYNKCYTMMNLDQHPEIGVTIIVTPKWLFVAALTGPYTTNKGMPVYVDGYAYTGIVNAQVTEKQWPATAGLVNDEYTPFDILEKSSQLGRTDQPTSSSALY